MSRDFYELCYDQYKLEMADADALYQKTGVMLVVVSLLGTVIAKISRIDVFDLIFLRVDVFIFYFSTLSGLVLLGSSIYFLFRLAYPGKYQTLDSMGAWQEWRIQYEEYLKKSKDTGNSPTDLDDAMFVNLCPRLAEAQPINAKLNEKRRKKFQYSVKMAALSLIAIAIQALFALLLALQGI